MLLVAVPAFAGAGGNEVSASKRPTTDNAAPASADNGKSRQAPGQAAKQESTATAGASSSDNGASGVKDNSNFGDQSKPQPLSGADKNGTGANPGQTCTHDYCSTRDGKDMGQPGQGGGGAGGRPCAGCVGNADNKNPPGQFRNGSDSNSGYECDGRDRKFPNQGGNGNHGIGDGNPAHTSCLRTTNECVPKAGEDKNCKPICVPKAGEDKNCKPESTTGGTTTGTTGTTSTGTTGTTGTGTTGTTGTGTTNGTTNGTTGGTTNGTAGSPTTGSTSEVQGIVLERPRTNPTTTGAAPAGERPTQVAGVQLSRGPLAFTGGDLLPLAATGFGSVATGLGALALRRRRDDEMVSIAERLEGHIL